MAFLAAVRRILQSNGQRADLPAADGTFGPVDLQLGPGLTYEFIPNGASGIVKVSVKGATNALGTATTIGNQAANLGDPIAIPNNTACTLEMSISGHIVGQRQWSVFQRRIFLPIDNINGTVATQPSPSFGVDDLSIYKTASPINAFSDFAGGPVPTVTNVANDGSAHCQVTVSTLRNIRQGSYVNISGVGGVPGANGTFVVDSLVGTTFVLRGSGFSGAYTSGGIVTVLGCPQFPASLTTPIQLQVQGLLAPPWLQDELVNGGDWRTNTTTGIIYQCATGGTTSNSGTGPTGTGTAIVDGTAQWDYYGPLASGITVFWTLQDLKQLPI